MAVMATPGAAVVAAPGAPRKHNGVHAVRCEAARRRNAAASATLSLAVGSRLRPMAAVPFAHHCGPGPRPQRPQPPPLFFGVHPFAFVLASGFCLLLF